MLKIVLIRPGSTDLNEQGRIKGTLDVPLSNTKAEPMHLLGKSSDGYSPRLLALGKKCLGSA